MKTLADLAPGQVGTIAAIAGTDALTLRLMELGILEGEQVRVVGKAPLGDPIEIALRGSKLSLRRVEAARVKLDLPDSSP
ncbi:MAG: iron transporter FeoA [Pirellulaceae bacterium]|nr:MAG: iron transporter FeoA [Pirellulaceae bacterium]